MSDASDDSDHFHGLVQEQEIAESESGASDSHPHYGSDADDWDSDADANALFDMSAEESGETASDDEDEDEDEDDYEDDSAGLDGYVNHIERSESPEQHFFPQFRRLPIELRWRIWELFCPDILAKARIYPFRHHPIDVIERTLLPGVHLGMMTDSSRKVLAVHRESREFALAAFPDAFVFQGATLRFNKEKDIILAEDSPSCRNYDDAAFYQPHLINQVRNIALSVPGYLHPECISMLRDWENPGTLYLNCAATDVLDDPDGYGSIEWCHERYHHRYRAKVFELNEFGDKKAVEYSWVWPNLEKYPDYRNYWFGGPSKVTYEEWAKNIRGLLAEDGGASPRFMTDLFLSNIRPMIEFYGRDDGPLYFGIAREAGRGLDGDDSDSEILLDSDESDEPNEYESEGIDDSDIEEPEENSGDEDDLIVRDDDSGDDDDESAFEGFSPRQDHSSPARFRGTPRLVDLGHNDDEARFSSPELDEDDSQTARGSDSDEDKDMPQQRPRARVGRSRSTVVESADEDEDEVSAQPAPKANKRKRVLDSDDEDEVVDDEDGEAPRKRTRISRSAPILVPDDDSEDETSWMRRNTRRSRAVVTDDDDEDDEDGEGDRNGEDDESDDSEDEDVEETSRPLTLMERLELHRRDNPTPGESDEEDGSEDPNMEEMGEDDYDARNYGDFEDDDEGVDPSDDAGDGEGIDYDEGDDDGEEYY